MRRGLATSIACCALVILAGCGSSSTSTTGTPANTTPSTAAENARGGGIKVDTTPKFIAPAGSAPVQSGTVHVAYRDIAIEPDTLRVKVGSTIKWTNYDSVVHNVTSEGGAGGTYKFASKNFGEGGTFELKVTKPGVIHYENTLQPVTMNGTIEVVK